MIKWIKSLFTSCEVSTSEFLEDDNEGQMICSGFGEGLSFFECKMDDDVLKIVLNGDVVEIKNTQYEHETLIPINETSIDLLVSDYKVLRKMIVQYGFNQLDEIIMNEEIVKEAQK